MTEKPTFGYYITKNLSFLEPDLRGGLCRGEPTEAMAEGYQTIPFRMVDPDNPKLKITGLCWGQGKSSDMMKLCGLLQEDLVLEFLQFDDQEWQPKEHIPNPKSPDRYTRDVMHSADFNHIWANAFTLINPTEEMIKNIGQSVLNMWNRRESRIKASYVKDEGTSYGDEIIIRFNAS